MITLSLVPLFGVALAALACWCIHHSHQGRCKAIQQEADEGVRDKLRRAKDLDAKFVESIMSGIDIDEAIDVFAKDRTGIHTHPSNNPALWEVDDLKKASVSEVKQQTASMLSRSRLVSFSVCIGLFFVVAATEAILYSQMSMSQPVLSPQALPKKSATFPNSVVP